MNLTRNLFSALLPAASVSADWNSLRLLNSYRLFVAVILLVGFIAGPEGLTFGATLPAAFYVASALYVVIALAFAAGLYVRRPSAQTQAHLQLYTDILILAFATYSSGGMASGLAVLMVVPVAGAGILLPLRHALLFAALATLLVLGGELARMLDAGADASQFVPAALLGAALFVSASLAAVLARRSAISAEIAERRSRDVRNLSVLNERIIQQMEAGIIVVDRRGLIVLANASAWQLLGDPARVEGENLAGVAPGLQQALDDWHETGRAPAGPIQAHGETGSGAPRLQVHFTDLGDLGTLVSLEDAAFIEDQLQQLKLASLGRLTASIAHEVRNPLGAISHATQLLAESPGLGRDDQRFTRIILDHCKRVNSIVDNVLQLSRRRPVDSEPLDLAAWLQTFANEFRASHGLDADRFRLTLDTSPDAVAIDPDHLHQAVANLCGNALEHGQRTDGRPVSIHLQCRRDEAGMPIIDIEDDGQPIDPARIDDMFEPFYSTRHGGTGLGLFLARELCEANGAHLRYRLGTATSGNCFRITLQPAETDRRAARM